MKYWWHRHRAVLRQCLVTLIAADVVSVTRDDERRGELSRGRRLREAFAEPRFQDRFAGGEQPGRVQRNRHFFRGREFFEPIWPLRLFVPTSIVSALKSSRMITGWLLS